MIAKRISTANCARRGAEGEAIRGRGEVARGGRAAARGAMLLRAMRAGAAPLAALLLGLALAAAPARAQSAKLADDPAAPADTPAAATPATNPAAGPATPDAPAQPDYNPGRTTTDSGRPDLLRRRPAGSSPDSASKADPSKPVLHRPGDDVAPVDLLPDALHAVKSIEVGDFYMKKGDYDAAIDRYEEAARLNPKLARPYLLLGEAYEKKSDASSAVTSYRKYLDLNHTAPDRDKIMKRIERLQGKSDRSS